MKLHDLKRIAPRPSRKRVGRGDSSGQGQTAGRGNKGAGQRTGATRRPNFEGGQLPLFRRLPKRGFKNPNHQVYSVVNVRYLEQHFTSGAEVDETTLVKMGIIGRSGCGLKVLGDGDLTKALSVKANKFSASARRKIEAAGGACVEI